MQCSSNSDTTAFYQCSAYLHMFVCTFLHIATENILLARLHSFMAHLLLQFKFSSTDSWDPPHVYRYLQPIISFANGSQ